MYMYFRTATSVGIVALFHDIKVVWKSDIKVCNENLVIIFVLIKKYGSTS